jgi:hypothetical protein
MRMDTTRRVTDVVNPKPSTNAMPAMMALATYPHLRRIASNRNANDFDSG